jgi:hypothetical protein
MIQYYPDFVPSSPCLLFLASGRREQRTLRLCCILREPGARKIVEGMKHAVLAVNMLVDERTRHSETKELGEQH